MSAIRHGREVLPAWVRPPARPVRYRCGWCPFTGTRDEVDVHEDDRHPITPHRA